MSTFTSNIIDMFSIWIIDMEIDSKIFVDGVYKWDIQSNPRLGIRQGFVK